MANTTIILKDAANNNVAFVAQVNPDQTRQFFYTEDETQRAALEARFTTLSTSANQTTLNTNVGSATGAPAANSVIGRLATVSTKLDVLGDATATPPANTVADRLGRVETALARVASIGDVSVTPAVNTVTGRLKDVSDAVGPTNESAPPSDTAASALNGRLQRIAQNLTTLISRLPTSLGIRPASGSLSVAPASDASFVVTGTAGGPVAVTVPTNTTSTRAYDFANGQRLSVSSTSARTTAVAASEVMVHASTRCFIRIGDNTVVASSAAGSFPLEIGEKFHLRLTSGQFVAAIRDTADGFLTVMPVA